jgi:ABC-type branched-subunit amino acid transport system ATPase component
MNGAPLIEVEHLTMRFGGLVAVDDVSFSARPREITAIIGPNGAGKTTVFNCITGFYKPTVGRLTLRAEREYLLERMLGHEIGQKAKVARTFQNIRLFPGMTVLENLMVAQHNKLMRASRAAGWSASISWPTPTGRPASCLTAPSGGSRSRAPCARSRGCSASTSRRPGSTRVSRPSSIRC